MMDLLSSTHPTCIHTHHPIPIHSPTLFYKYRLKISQCQHQIPKFRQEKEKTMKMIREEQEQALIPGLPEDVALDCISRIPHRFLSQIRPVCRKWCDLVTAPAFHIHRERVGATEDLVFLVQALKGDDRVAEAAVQLVDPVTAYGELKEELTAAANPLPPVYSLSLYNATLATWHWIASPDPIPMFSQCAIVGEKLILVGGWDPTTLDPVADTRILDLATMMWRKGRPMASARSFFACAATGGKVYVAGGHDGQKNALRSAEAYDVAADEWVSLPPMTEERDESKGLIHGGKFWAVSGYSTENQGRFATSAEWYDPDEGEWTRADGVWDDATCASCFGLGEMMMGSVDSRGVREFNGKEWRVVGPAPEGMRASTCGAVIGDGNRVFVTGGEGKGGWVMDFRTRKRVRVETPAGFSGSVYAAAAVRY